MILLIMRMIANILIIIAITVLEKQMVNNRQNSFDTSGQVKQEKLTRLMHWPI